MKTARYRFYEMIPGFVIWFIFLGAIILSFVKPIWAIYWIIIYDLYWVLRIIYLLIFLLISWHRFKITTKINWFDKLTLELPGWEKIYHLIMLPSSVEGLDVVKQGFESLLKTNYPKEKFIVVLTGEERKKHIFEPVAKAIGEKYGDKFFKLLITTHPKDLPDEIPGKGSNTNWAGHQVKKIIDEIGIPYENIIVSCFDVDTSVHKEYFSYLTYRYLTDPDPTHTSYQPIAIYNNNIWDSPALTRVVARGTTFWLFTELAKPNINFTFASHSMPFKALVDVGFWPKDMVSEDSRTSLMCLNYYNGNYKVVPLYMPVSMDTVYSGSFWKSMVSQYKQMRRWGYGIENVPWMIENFGKNKKMPWQKKILPFFSQFEGSISWATVSILILMLGSLPIWVAKLHNISDSIVLNAPFILEWLMNVALVGMITSAVFSTILLPPRPSHHKSYKYLFMILQWLLFPITMLIFGSIPATEAITRLMLGKYLGFYITEKKRIA
ncbi:MAG: glycosyltransferase family 2 protein [Patescibacteria group bacterium]|nr:glycosyltransferase family 2 protein [Patescibacteria group bacterium]MDD5121523.1 glycosyltransferase family 2 protein [Patescibacteria group bacterium]MDD5221853.1 glycosyltransferase family 2 protein [Patescibacteria group bacterium]MDD5396314.1 glycosyltransferase family 2 protein [Patescibacteria group bacterium]